MYCCQYCNAVGKWGALGCPACQKRFEKSECLNKAQLHELVTFAEKHLPYGIAMALAAIYRGNNNEAVMRLLELPS
jgi:hypothetical protein